VSLPPFPTTTVGSWPRPDALLQAQRDKQGGRLGGEEFERRADAAVLDFLRLQEEIGIDIVTDGEQRRDNFYSFVAEKLVGVRLMTLGEMLEYVEDKQSFEELLQRLDVPSFAIKNPTCIGPVSRRSSLAAEEVRFLRNHTDRPIKVPLPGPYILTRAMWVPEVTQAHYASKEELAEVVVELLCQEVRDVIAAGADFIQFDEPVLTELVFTQGKTRTFMCAALASRKDPAEELAFATSLINRVAAAAGTTRVGVHVCRGNWSRREETLLSGSYRPLAPVFAEFEVDQLVLEYATDRAGDLVAVPGKEVGLGVVNPRTDDVESIESIVSRGREAAALWSADKVFLNPDCGFATFSEREMNAPEVAAAKLRAMVAAARELRER